MKTCEKFNGYEALAEAIVVQAGIDYLDYKMQLETADTDEKKKKLESEIAKIEAFFRSRWYLELTDTNPEWLLNKLNEGYEELKRTNNLDKIKQLQRV